LSISTIAEQVCGLDVVDPPAFAPGLRAALAEVEDPRKARGVRHRLVTVLVVAVCAVAAGARSFVAVAEWVTDLPAELAETLDVAGRRPSESTIRRLLGTLDADRFDAVIGGFVQRLCAGVNSRERRRVLAVDGKTLRGSRHGDQPGRHLLAVIDHQTRVVLGQLSVSDKTNEITAFAPLLNTLNSIDLTGVVFTADALHTQRDHVEQLHRRGAHWLLTVKGNQPSLRRQLAALPWKQLEVAHRTVETGHGRREIRTIKVVTIDEHDGGIAFHGGFWDTAGGFEQVSGLGQPPRGENA
jgi:predicted transposase YbfD/YdcC